jgi:hypothetical protein
MRPIFAPPHGVERFVSDHRDTRFQSNPAANLTRFRFACRACWSSAPRLELGRGVAEDEMRCDMAAHAIMWVNGYFGEKLQCAATSHRHPQWQRTIKSAPRVPAARRSRRSPGLRAGALLREREELRGILAEKVARTYASDCARTAVVGSSVGGLLGRDYKNVSTDITLLERWCLVRLEATTGKGRAQTPTVSYDEIHVTIDSRRPHETAA